MNLKGLDIDTIEAVMDALPVDLSFVDSEDRVRFFNTPKDKPRIFPRTKMDLGRKVQNCHPPQSLDKVNAILDGFRKGEMKEAVFWIEFRGRKIYISYFPVTGPGGEYLGTIEMTQDITDIQKIEGEKRLLSS
ncbi:MAG TPA: DUF438 domain-containing protein [Firmicutes bacterium]|nr:DUF438 domain-containing protein [Bacillota bacterium]